MKDKSVYISMVIADIIIGLIVIYEKLSYYLGGRLSRLHMPSAGNLLLAIFVLIALAALLILSLAISLSPEIVQIVFAAKNPKKSLVLSFILFCVNLFAEGISYFSSGMGYDPARTVVSRNMIYAHMFFLIPLALNALLCRTKKDDSKFVEL